MCMRAWRGVVDDGSELNMKLRLRKLEHEALDGMHAYRLRRRDAVVGTEHNYFIMKIRSGPRHTQAVAVAHATWWRRLRSTVRGVLTWVALVGKRERTRARVRARWRDAYEMVRDEIRSARGHAVATPTAPTTDPKAADTRRSVRLETVPEPRYREAREWHERGDRGSKRRRAVAAVFSTRVGIRLKQWLERACDAGGPGDMIRDDG